MSLCDLPLEYVLSTMGGRAFLRVLHIVEERQHLSKLIHGIGRHALCAVFRVEPFQALMDNIPYFHQGKCSL